MQVTRQHILDILREKGQATVDELVGELETRRGTAITAVTVRHHLNELLKENLVSTSDLKHRTTPGRPRHVYILTEGAIEYFPNNYQSLLHGLVKQIEDSLSTSQANVLFEGVADSMASKIQISFSSTEERLSGVVDYLNQHGYNAQWEYTDGGFVLRTNNCPYHHIAETNQLLCNMDMRIVSSLIGVVPRLISRMSEGKSTCSYFIPVSRI